MPKAKSVFKSGRGLRVGAALTDDLGSLHEHELGFKDGALYSRIDGEIVKVLGGSGSGPTIVYPMMGGAYAAVAEDGSEYRYGVTIDGEELTVRMQVDAELKLVFALPVAKNSSGVWENVSEDEGDLLGMIWSPVSPIAGVSHNLPVQGVEVARVQMGDGWADVKLGSGDDFQVAQVIAFSNDLRPGMAEFMEGFGISGDLLDEMLSAGVPVVDTPLAPGIHIEEPRHIVYGSVTIADKAYKTVRIGNQEWLAENLDAELGTIGTDCFMYKNDPEMRAKYGLLYPWPTLCSGNEQPSDMLTAILPEGWRLPSKGDFDVLSAAVGGDAIAGTALKSVAGWDLDISQPYRGAGTDNYGFSIFPAGYRYNKSSYLAGKNSYFWTATEYSSTNAYGIVFYTDPSAVSNWGSKTSNMFSVRLVKDVT